MKDIKTLHELLEPTVTALGFELWGCVYVSQGRHSVLRIYIDSANGIMVTDCERVSRQLSALLDVEDPLPGKYTLEVSSPGLDRPLFTLKQFQRFIGSQVNVYLHTAVENRKHLKGLLLDVKANEIVMNVDKQTMVITSENIAKANLSLEKQA